MNGMAAQQARVETLETPFMPHAWQTVVLTKSTSHCPFYNTIYLQDFSPWVVLEDGGMLRVNDALNCEYFGMSMPADCQ